MGVEDNKKIITILKKQEYLNKMVMSMFGVFLGAILNVMAITLNNGTMPVITDKEFNSVLHTSYTTCEEVVRCYLTDIIYIKIAYISIGDVIMVTSAIYMIIIQIKHIINKRKNKK